MKKSIAEPIAIVGMACRFPGAPTLAEFWNLLSEGRDAVTDVPPGRWDVDAVFDADPKAQGKTNSRRGGFISDIDQFDAGFFGITPREAGQMDPQQRILLELAYDAIEDAGIAPASLAGTPTSVFVGAMTNDYFRQQLGDGFRRIDVHTGSGAGLCMLANRLSYQFDLRGPSVTVDTACSSSLVAVFQACQSLWTGQSRTALAAGVNVMLDPAINVFYTKAGLSAPDARCKTFSAAADGIGRAEGGAVVVLKRLKDAIADRDPIYAMIRGGAVNHDGRSNGLTQPNRWAQEQLLRAAFQHARVDPRDLQYIELHGTGTLIGDPIEANALGAVLRDSGEREPCLVGSVKTNFGHLEAAAGIAGLIKVALGIAKGSVPPSLWFDAPNPHIDFDSLPLRVNAQLSPWLAAGGRCLAGVSSFGLGGANAHLVVQSAPPARQPARRARPSDGVHCLLLSGRSEAALKACARSTLDWLEQHPDASLPAVCASSLRRKGVHEHRLAVLGRDVASAVEVLRAVSSGQPHQSALSGRFRPSQRALVLVAPALDAVDWRVLSAVVAQPVAREAWTACRNVFGRHRIALPTVDALDDSVRISINHPEFRAWHFCVQYAMARQMLAGCRELHYILADGFGQVAMVCALGATSMAEVAELLVAAMPSLELGHDAVYPVRCDFASGIDPRTIRFQPQVPPKVWQERLHASPEHCDSDIIVLGPAAASDIGAGELFAASASPDAWPRMFARLAMRHALDWPAWAAEEPFVRLPSYPWQREGHWLPSLDERARSSQALAGVTRALPVSGAQAGEALLGAAIDAPTSAWTRRLSPDELPYLADHEVQGAVILPGAGFVELGLAVHAATRRTVPARLTALEFHNALVIDPAQPPGMHVSLDESTGMYGVHTKRGGGWELHARGRIQADAKPVACVDLPALQARCTRHVDAAAHYGDMHERGFGYGPAFQGVHGLWLEPGGERVLARIVRPDALGPASQGEHLHPALLDAALQSMLATLTARGDRELYIPTGIEELTFHRTAPAAFWCHGGLRHAGNGRIEGDIVLFDDDGQPIAQATGVRAQALTRKERTDARSSDDGFYRWSWESRPRAAGTVPGTWLVLGDRQRASEVAQALLEGDGIDAVCVPVAERLGQDEGLEGARFDSELEALLGQHGERGLAGVIYTCPGASDGAPLRGTTVMPLVSLMRSMARLPTAPRLVVLTRQLLSVEPAGVSEAATSPAHSAALALTRVATNEYPQLRVRLVDAGSHVTMGELARELASDDAEDEVALRAGERFVPRLRPVVAEELDAAPGRPIRAGATYLITGGYGGFGLELADWLAAQGATHLVLVGRRGAQTPEAQRRIRKLRVDGVQVMEAKADVAEESQVQSLLLQVRAAHPPLAGVFHAAAALDDAPLDQLTSAQIDHAMGAKACGAWHLHRLTHADGLDHFVLFSSIASLLGGAGQGSYAISCAYLDALARCRRAQGLPGLSLNWGALAEVGMATRFGDVGRYLGSTGVGLFSPQEAMQRMARALAWPHAELGVARMDWPQWALSYPSWANAPRYAGLVAGTAAKTPVQSSARAALMVLPPTERAEAIATTLAQLLAQVIEADADEVDRSVPLPSLGMDSLMAMDLLVAIEDRFGVKVPMLALMKGNNLLEVAQLIGTQLTQEPEDPTAQAVAVRKPAAPSELPETLGLEEAERLIARLGEMADEEVERLLQQIMHEEETR